MDAGALMVVLGSVLVALGLFSWWYREMRSRGYIPFLERLPGDFTARRALSVALLVGPVTLAGALLNWPEPVDTFPALWFLAGLAAAYEVLRRIHNGRRRDEVARQA